MAKVSIIEVDLGFSVSDLINEDVAGLVGEAQKELETAISTAKKANALREQKEREAQESVDKISAVMATAYDNIKTAGEEGVPADQIMAVIDGAIPNISAFTLRMKKILRDNGNEYAIIKKKKGGVPHYIFIPFNQ